VTIHAGARGNSANSCAADAVLAMSTNPVVSGRDALRHAITWLAEQESWSPELIQEACLRFDVSPADEEFLIAENRRQREQPQRQR